MNWLQKTNQQSLDSDITNDVNYPIAGSVVNGLRVDEQIDNMSSIGASLYQYEILSDVREIPMSDFDSPEPHNNFYSRTDIERCHLLAEEIRASGEIMPLIVVVDHRLPAEGRRLAEGPYILEGGHRFVALHLLGLDSFPALVVLDESP